MHLTGKNLIDTVYQGFIAPGTPSLGEKGGVNMSNRTVAKTGQPAPVSGQYRAVGGNTEVTLTKGKTTPPNNTGVRQQFVLVDKTKHKA